FLENFITGLLIVAQKKVIQIIGFRGTGTSYQEFSEAAPLIIYGHVGIKFEDDSIIYGFRPDVNDEDTLDLKEFKKLMINRTAVDGKLYDDTEIFIEAYTLSENRPSSLLTDEPDRLLVYVLSFE